MSSTRSMLIFQTLIYCALGCRPSAPQGDGHDWIKPPPESMSIPPPEATSLDGATQDINETDIYEVVASKNYVPVVRDLKDRSFVKLTPDEGQWFTGHYFRCPVGKTPYLIRAVFGHGGTGGYTVKRSGRKLFVSHTSLGTTTIENKSALVVNLDFEPVAVYTTVSIDE